MKQEKTPNKGKLKNAIAKTPETMVQKTSTKGLKKQLNAENQEKSKVNKNQTPMKKKGPVTPVNGFSKQNGSPVKKGQENQGTPGNKKGKGQNQGAQVQNVNGQQKKATNFHIPDEVFFSLSKSQRRRLKRKRKRELLKQQEDHLIHICMKGKKKTGQDDEDDDDDDDEDEDEDEEESQLFVFFLLLLGATLIGNISFILFLLSFLLLTYVEDINRSISGQFQHLPPLGAYRTYFFVLHLSELLLSLLPSLLPRPNRNLPAGSKDKSFKVQLQDI
ncbi:hypothetical protein RUM43_015039 [Polyplax serrata]|uniref:Uncharacterized protein n=1 Tax=Polyplax serrata TaxID=468196 RepID=A0AAN8P3L2_POLSC